MNFFTAHPVTISLALVALVIWTAGNYLRKKLFVIIGAAICIAALIFFAFGK